MTSAASLNVAVIVKDEERVIGRLLESLRPLGADVILVDTGSTDRTRDIGQSHGAKVFDFREASDADGRLWDFAAARNYALAQCQSGWVLQVDADEVVSGLDAIADAILGVPAAISCRIMSGNLDWLNVRLFHRSVAVEYRSPIHEYLVVDGVQYDRPEIIVRNLPDKKGKESGHDRNTRILRRALRSEPRAARLWHHLGNEYRSVSRFRAAKRCYTQALRHVGNRPMAYNSLFYKGVCALMLDQEQVVLDIGERMVRRNPNRSESYCLMGDACFKLADFSRAEMYYARAIGCDAAPLGAFPTFEWTRTTHPIQQLERLKLLKSRHQK